MRFRRLTYGMECWLAVREAEVVFLERSIRNKSKLSLKIF